MTHPNATPKVAIYCRVSTSGQDCQRQRRELEDFAARSNMEVVGVFEETASGAKNDREQRAKVIDMARKRHIDSVLVTELSRWGRSTQDLLQTLEDLSKWNVNILALNGQQLDIKSAMGKMLLTVLSAVSEFERDLIKERVRSGLANAQAKGKKLGRQHGQNPSDKYAGRVVVMLNNRQSIRSIASELQISTTTVQAIAKRRGVRSVRRAKVKD